MYEVPDLQRAFDEGAQAAAAGQTRHANPYPADSFRAATWARGFDGGTPDAAPAPIWFAPGTVERYAPPRRGQRWLTAGLAAALAVTLSLVLGYTAGFFNPWGVFW